MNAFKSHISSVSKPNNSIYLSFMDKIYKILNDENFQFIGFVSLVSSLGIYLSYKLIILLKNLNLKKVELNLSKLNMGLVAILKRNNHKIKNKNEKSKYYYPSGLINYANNCYINVFLQCISTLKSFASFSNLELIKKCNKSNYDLLKAFHDTLDNINSSLDKIIYPGHLISNICYKFEFANEQQDSYELYHRIIDLYSSNSDNENPLKISIESKFKCESCLHVRYIDIIGN